MTPLSGTRVVHGRFIARHAPTLASARTSNVMITRGPGAETYDAETGTTVPGDGVLVYEGPARVQAAGGQATERVVGQAPGTVREYLVEIPADQDAVRVGDLVAVTGVDELTGLVLTVADVGGASIAWSRALTCSVDLRT